MSIGSIKNTIAKAPKAVLRETNKVGNYVISKLPKCKDKADKFIKSDLNKVNKSTAVGAAVFVAAIGLAAGCIKTIHSKIKEVKENN